MLIGKVSKTTGVSKETLRYYDKLGLLEFDTSTRQLNGYRDFPEEVIGRIYLIKNAQVLGFTLKEITRIFRKWEDGDYSKEEKRALFENKIQEIECRMNELIQVKKYLKDKIAMIC